jgi:undecaprenyl-diphosphatase
MNIVQTLILSVVEGITEFLPISSTGHLILVSNFLKITQTDFVKSFEIIIQLGAILSVVVIYFKRLIKNTDLWKKIIIAFLPSAIFGALFYKLIKTYLIGNSLVVVLSLILGGIVMILFEKYHKDKEKDLNLKHYLLIGMFQVFSMIPGVSRAFATIFGGMIVGMSRKKATEFSFFLAIPTMFGATVLDLIKTDVSVWTNSNLVTLLIGFLASFVTAYVVVKWLIKFVQTHNFVGFGWYRIVLTTLFAFYILGM